MSEAPRDPIADDEILWKTREFIKDCGREVPQPYDSPLQAAARKYLKSRSSRIRIEREMGSKMDAFPRRLVEVIRARKLEKLGGVEFFSKRERDNFLPTFARLQVDEAPDLPQMPE